MNIREHQLKELARARELQDEAAKLHIPVPVLSWEFEVTDKAGGVIEKGVGKANSFTRNALNNLAFFVGLADYGVVSSSFGDGFLSGKKTDGTSLAFNASNHIGRFINSSYNPQIYVGTGTTETLDDYALPSYACENSVITAFNTETRKLVTILSGVYLNASGSAIDITEAGVRQCIGSSGSAYMLMVHDVFAAISVPDGATIVWKYVTEIAYPNP